MPFGNSGSTLRWCRSSASAAVIAHRGEHVGLARTHTFERMLGLHTVRACQLVERLAAEPARGLVARVRLGRDTERRQRPAEHRRVRREDRANARNALLQMEQGCPRHPLVRLHDGPAMERGEELLPPALDHHARGRREQHRLDIVPVARDRVDFVPLPETRQDAVLLFVEAREADQDAARPTGDAPAPDPDRHAELTARLDEVLVAGLFVERRLHASAARQLRAHRDVVVAEAFDRGHRLARQHGVDAADLVADLPADLEQLERTLRHGHCLLFSAALPTCSRRWSRAVMRVTNAACGES